MLDIKQLRNDIENIAKNLLKRGFKFDIDKFNHLEVLRKELQIKMQDLQKQRNEKSKEIGFRKSKGEDIQPIFYSMEKINQELKETEKNFEKVHNELEEYLMTVPNTLHDSVPEGESEEQNELIREYGKIKEYNFTPKEHDEIAIKHDMGIDFELSSHLSGSRFYVLKNKIARLHRALGQFMLDVHVEKHGYMETHVPLLVKSHALYGTGQFPKFRDDQFGTLVDDYWLIPTAEVPVTNFVSNKILDARELPLKFACLSTCFRREAGAYGKDTKGMMRLHQFDKVELVQIVEPDKSYEALEELISHAEVILKLLEIPYRVMNLCSCDLGFAAAKTYDIEVWMPGQNRYREVSSCSNTEAFQARRMNARVRKNDNKTVMPLHTLNGSGLALPRTLIAVIENYQDENGNIHIPDVLVPYMGGTKVI